MADTIHIPNEDDTALTDRRIAFGGAKIALLCMIAICLSFAGLTWLLNAADVAHSFAINLLFLALALNFGANGVLVILEIVDWFKGRRGAARG